ncbi:MAG TPA: amino acid ABC transporter permease, partial [Rhodopila sp.]|nr:amino acid ABC transporter permease [Rhodopila sp.]
MSQSTAQISEAARDPVPAIAGVPAAPISRPPPLAAGVGPLGWARANLFNSVPSTAVTLVLLYLIVKWAISFVEWGLIHAVWSVPQTATGADSSPCREVKGIGACWAVITDKYRF